MYRIGIDIGGTFTDLAAVDDDGHVVIAKVSSTPHDPSEGLLDGLHALARELGLDRATLLARTDHIVHGTTVATNALLERKGARVALLTTDGHRDVIEMREGLKDDRYNVRMAPPVPLVERRLRIGVRERMRFDGSVEVPLSPKALDDAITQVELLGVDAIAVCYLHSYANDAHELVTKRALGERLPCTYLSVSSEVLPQIKEFERTWTTVVNAYVGPILSNYLARLLDQLRDAGYASDVAIMHSHGGIAPVPETQRVAAGAVLSGPAGGIAAAGYAVRLLDEGNLLTFDMGGTSTDISLLQDGEATVTGSKQVGIARVSLPSLDIHTLGAGGGSIARVAGSILHVGPESAGADPGPACYGRGGTAATVTDANVVLGFLDPANFLGGRIELDAQAAERAVEQIGRTLGTSAIAAAEGISRVVNTNMAEGIRLVSIRRGVDPRSFALVAFGGAAGLHVTEVARLLEIKRVVVPNVAAVLSAWGMLATDLRYEMVRSHVADVTRTTAADLRRVVADMERQGRGQLGDFAGDVAVRAALDMRYGEQIFEITVSIEGIDLDSGDAMHDIVERFHARHEELYSYSAPGQDVVIVNVRLTVIGRLPDLRAEPLTTISRKASSLRHRRVYLGSWTDVPVYALDELPGSPEVKGPAIFESPTTTVLIRDGERATVTPHGWLDIEVR